MRAISARFRALRVIVAASPLRGRFAVVGAVLGHLGLILFRRIAAVGPIVLVYGSAVNDETTVPLFPSRTPTPTQTTMVVSIPRRQDSLGLIVKDSCVRMLVA